MYNDEETINLLKTKQNKRLDIDGNNIDDLSWNPNLSINCSIDVLKWVEQLRNLLWPLNELQRLSYNSKGWKGAFDLDHKNNKRLLIQKYKFKFLPLEEI